MTYFLWIVNTEQRPKIADRDKRWVLSWCIPVLDDLSMTDQGSRGDMSPRSQGAAREREAASKASVGRGKAKLLPLQRSPIPPWGTPSSAGGDTPCHPLGDSIAPCKYLIISSLYKN